MKIAMIQMAVSAGSWLDNEKKICAYIEKGHQAGAEIICFPEMVMVGYGFDNLDARFDHQSLMLQHIQNLVLDLGMTVIIGGIEKEDEDFYISQFIVGEGIESYRKTHVGQKEAGYFAYGDTIKTFEVKGLRIGIMLCYDGHFPELATIMADQGADLILNPSASPNKPAARLKMWHKYLPARAYDNRVWVAATNLRFKGKGGGMMVIDGDGNLVGQSEAAEDDLLIFDYKKTVYSETSMRRRNFRVDRRPDVYQKYLR